MNISITTKATGKILKTMSLFFLLPALVGVLFRDFWSVKIFVVSGLIAYLAGFLLNPEMYGEKFRNDVKKSEALAIVAISWIFVSLLSAVPYLFYGFSPLNALFEAVSGITTTGSTILTESDFKIFPETMFFWRALTQWLGGMGIIVLFIAILPQFAVAGRQMFSAEAPGPTDNKLTPRIKDTAAILWKMYLLFTALELIILYAAGMPLFDAVCYSFSTVSTGGLSPNSAGIIGYGGNIYIQVVMFFTFLSGIGYAMLYKVFRHFDFVSLKKNEEFWVYTIFTLVCGTATALILYFSGYYPTLAKSFGEAFFQVISILTSSGFVTSDYTAWGFNAQMVLLLLMFSGACAGSTSGGLKIIRLIFLYKYIKSELKRIFHPNAVFPVVVNGNVVPPEVMRQMISFMVFYVLIAFISGYAASLTEQSFEIGFSGAISSLGNIGPGFGKLGPVSNFDFLKSSTKMIYIFDMLVGRLEIIPFLALFSIDFSSIKKG